MSLIEVFLLVFTIILLKEYMDLRSKFLEFKRFFYFDYCPAMEKALRAIHKALEALDEKIDSK